MDVNKLTSIITILLTLSIATERLVEIVRGIWTKFLQPRFKSWGNMKPVNPEMHASPATTVNAEMPVNQEDEQWDKVKIYLLTIVCGIFTAFLASPLLAGIFKDLFPKDSVCNVNINIGMLGTCGFELNGNGSLIIIALGFLASGGSGVWNSILEYVLKIKDLKKTEVNKAKIEYAMTVKQAERQGAIPIRSIENKNEVITEIKAEE